MNKKIIDLTRFMYKRSSLVSQLGLALMFVAITGLALALIVFIVTGLEDGLFERTLCLKNACIDRFQVGFSSVGLILQVTWNIVGGMITAGGIVIALLSYLASARSSALNNHISHMSIFSTYTYSEIDKRDRLNRKSFDPLKWYNAIYGTKTLGDLRITNNYYVFVAGLNRLIKKSNDLLEKSEEGGFRYKDHQERIKECLLAIGIELKSLPRLDFYEVETQVFELIVVINKSFCHSSVELELVARKYL
ncbi:retron Ec48 family effector membrane protein [Pseudomonas sp. DWP3-1-2]|uniref:retron Ec48 family effector membrane protein n=1 Tax=Pseudomonas sp. DWP3-1-2 TaxID=2804645 RepID=UPI003CEA7833